MSHAGDPLRPGDRGLVAGASSQVGRFLLPRLLARGLRVDALSRRPAPRDYPAFEGLRWVDPGSVRERLAGHAWLVSAGPLALALELAGHMPALKAVSLTSTSSVLSKIDSPDVEERREMEMIRDAEEAFRALARTRELPLLILRPTLVYGCGMDRNLSVYARFIRRFGFLPLSSRAHGLRQPVHADDVARALAAGLGPRPVRELVGPLCGGDTLDYRTMVERLFTALRRRPRLLALPPGLLAAGVRVGGWLRVSGAGSPEMVRRQALDLVFDDRALRATLGVEPRRFHPSERDFQSPTRAVLERLRAGQ